MFLINVVPFMLISFQIEMLIFHSSNTTEKYHEIPPNIVLSYLIMQNISLVYIIPQNVYGS